MQKVSSTFVACSTDELLYAADTGNHCLQVLRSDSGEFVRKVGTEGSGQGQFSSPCGVCLDDDKGLVYVADGDYCQVLVHRQDTLVFVRAPSSSMIGMGQEARQATRG